MTVITNTIQEKFQHTRTHLERMKQYFFNNQIDTNVSPNLIQQFAQTYKNPKDSHLFIFISTKAIPHITYSSICCKDHYWGQRAFQCTIQIRKALYIQHVHLSIQVLISAMQLKSCTLQAIGLQKCTSSINNTPGTSSAMPSSIYRLTTCRRRIMKIHRANKRRHKNIKFQINMEQSVLQHLEDIQRPQRSACKRNRSEN